jgi:hypothetical protein
LNPQQRWRQAGRAADKGARQWRSVPSPLCRHVHAHGCSAARWQRVQPQAAAGALMSCHHICPPLRPCHPLSAEHGPLEQLRCVKFSKFYVNKWSASSLAAQGPRASHWGGFGACIVARAATARSCLRLWMWMCCSCDAEQDPHRPQVRYTASAQPRPGGAVRVALEVGTRILLAAAW